MAAKLTAILGSCKRTGRWKIRPHTKALVLFGNCKIDYRDAYADDDLEEIKLDVLCLFGRAVFTLPPGTNVQPSSVSVLSSSNFEVEATSETSELPSIKMEAITIFGKCRVHTFEDTSVEDIAEEVIAAEASAFFEPTADENNRDRSPAPELESALPPLLPPPAPLLPPTEIAVGEPAALESSPNATPEPDAGT